MWLLYSASMHGASTQPRLKVLPHAYRVLVCWCIGMLVCWCISVLVYDVWLLCDASMHGASTQPKLTVLPHAYRVLVCWCVVVLFCWCVGVLCWWVGGCVGVLWCWCIVYLCILSFCLISMVIFYELRYAINPSPRSQYCFTVHSYCIHVQYIQQFILCSK